MEGQVNPEENYQKQIFPSTHLHAWLKTRSLFRKNYIVVYLTLTKFYVMYFEYCNRLNQRLVYTTKTKNTN